MGAHTSGFSTHVTPPISHIRVDDTEMLFGDDEDDDLDIDQLLLTSKASTSDAYSKTIVESILERVTKEHSTNVSTLSKAVSDSTDVLKLTTEKVNKLIADTMQFMEDYKTTYNSNTVAANKAIQNIGILFQTKNLNFVELCKAPKSDHEAYQSSIIEQITMLQDDLATKK
ncbi:unnamed protein product [Lactuca saligna]|uniref:Uncharacterized protein n=1 Tax=Lactuca saligna TaxID=75948 RepID=A0AA35YZ52_LACSI|nr:unnamed protein product [Lactuca saligna]